MKSMKSGSSLGTLVGTPPTGILFKSCVEHDQIYAGYDNLVIIVFLCDSDTKNLAIVQQPAFRRHSCRIQITCGRILPGADRILLSDWFSLVHTFFLLN